MNVKRFTGRTSREAMQKVRQQYGDDAVVLSTKPCPEGVEILAMAHDGMETIDRLSEQGERVAPSFADTPAAAQAPTRRKAAPAQQTAAPHQPAAASTVRDKFTEDSVQEDIKRLAMSTLSFQDYVRERLLKRRQAALKGHVEKDHIEPSFQPTASATPAMPSAPDVPQQSLAQRLAERQRTFAQAAQAAESVMKAATLKNVPPLALGDVPQAPAQVPVQHAAVQQAAQAEPVARPRAEVVPMPAPGARPAVKQVLRDPPVLREEVRGESRSDVRGDTRVPSLADAQQPSNARASAEMMDELRAMKGLIEERFGAIAFMEKLQRTPSQAHLAQRLLDCGFSPALIRKLLDGMPAEVISGAADEGDWAGTVLERNLLTGEADVAIEDQGGATQAVFALVGSTGVGKTTTTAKLAAAFAAKHGAHNLGLITLDAYRIGAHEQLRAYGRILGVPVHTAHDRPALEDLLELLSGKKMVLIDTAGMAQRDSRTRELLDMLAHPSIRKLVVVNAAAQGETIEDVLISYRAAAASGIVLSKLDEAVKLGPALDAVIRHKLKVIGVANGQRVPEDWHRLSAQALVHRALRSGGSPAYRLDANEVNLVFSTPTLLNPAASGAARRPGTSLPAGQ